MSNIRSSFSSLTTFSFPAVQVSMSSELSNLDVLHCLRLFFLNVAGTSTSTSTIGAGIAIDRDRKEAAHKDSVNVHSVSVPD